MRQPWWPLSCRSCGDHAKLHYQNPHPTRIPAFPSCTLLYLQILWTSDDHPTIFGSSRWTLAANQFGPSTTIRPSLAFPGGHWLQITLDPRRPSDHLWLFQVDTGCNAEKTTNCVNANLLQWKYGNALQIEISNSQIRCDVRALRRQFFHFFPIRTKLMSILSKFIFGTATPRISLLHSRYRQVHVFADPGISALVAKQESECEIFANEQCEFRHPWGLKCCVLRLKDVHT